MTRITEDERLFMQRARGYFRALRVSAQKDLLDQLHYDHDCTKVESEYQRMALVSRDTWKCSCGHTAPGRDFETDGGYFRCPACGSDSPYAE